MDQHPLEFLIGTWEGVGEGSYPTIDAFGYRETLEIARSPKGFLVHTQRTEHAVDGRPLHAETGYWRVPEAGRTELVLAHPTGITEVCEGEIRPGSVHVRSTVVTCSGSAVPVQTVERWYEAEDGLLVYRLSMGAVGLQLQPHLTGRLQRVRP